MNIKAFLLGIIGLAAVTSAFADVTNPILPTIQLNITNTTGTTINWEYQGFNGPCSALYGVKNGIAGQFPVPNIRCETGGSALINFTVTTPEKQTQVGSIIAEYGTGPSCQVKNSNAPYKLLAKYENGQCNVTISQNKQ